MNIENIVSKRNEVFLNGSIAAYDVFACRGGSYVCLLGHYGHLEDLSDAECFFDSNFSSKAEIISDVGEGGGAAKFHVRIALFPVPAAVRETGRSTVKIVSCSAVIADSIDLSFAAPKKKNYLAVTTLFKNENRFIKEWIDYHLAVGVEHFYLYDNDSHDTGQTLKILEEYLEKGFVTYIQWDYAYDRVEDANSGWRFAQRGQMHHSLYKYGDQNKWLLFIDMDEYVFPVNRTQKSITPYLQQCDGKDEVAGISLKSIWFGNSGFLEVPEGPVIKNYVLRNWRVEDKKNGRGCYGQDKYFVKPDKVSLLKIHAPAQYEEGAQILTASPKSLRLNHYYSISQKKRSTDFRYNNVMDRGMYKYLSKNEAAQTIGAALREWKHLVRAQWIGLKKMI